ncbi:MAG: regulatory protein RecX, partial [Ignavibacteriales bacterium]|nr:regulatory protein RecX [Ignavibacteriales bacterium]
KALRLVSYRRRSQKELRQRLLEKEFRPLVVDRVMAHLQSLGFVNDEEFARALVHDAQIKKASGRKLLHHRLREKGISPSIIRDVLTETLSEETEQNAALDAAKKLVERYGNSRKKIDQDKQRKRLAQALARRGFAWSIISPVLQTLFYNEPSSERET